jgi:hypothetical protein
MIRWCWNVDMDWDCYIVFFVLSFDLMYLGFFLIIFKDTAIVNFVSHVVHYTFVTWKHVDQNDVWKTKLS